MVAQLRTGEANVITPKLEKGESIRGTSVSNYHIAVWSAKWWSLYTTAGQLVCRQQSELKMPLVDVTIEDEVNGEESSSPRYHLIVKVSLDFSVLRFHLIVKVRKCPLI